MDSFTENYQYSPSFLYKDLLLNKKYLIIQTDDLAWHAFDKIVSGLSNLLKMLNEKNL